MKRASILTPRLIVGFIIEDVGAVCRSCAVRESEIGEILKRGEGAASLLCVRCRKPIERAA